MPPTLLVTLPDPDPAVATVNANCGVNVAATEIGAAPAAKLHVPVPEHPAPDQPLKTEPAAATADKVIVVGFV